MSIIKTALVMKTFLSIRTKTSEVKVGSGLYWNGSNQPDHILTMENIHFVFVEFTKKNQSSKFDYILERFFVLFNYF